MGHQFAKITFTDDVKALQEKHNSRGSYAKMEEGEDYNYLLSEREASFIQARDSFYMASVSKTGWPYVQHRGGPIGFMRILDAQTIGFADFSGNKQYVSTGNFVHNNRVALFFMDYPNRRRLKLLGRIQLVADDDWETLAKLEDPAYGASVERGFLIKVEAFDWNCPQHITPRYTDVDIQNLFAPLNEEIKQLKAQLQQRPEQTTKEIGSGSLALVISGIRQLTPEIRAYELRDPEGLELPAIQAGAHLKIPVLLDNGTTVERHYSICSNPARRDAYEIAVLRNPEENSATQSIHKQFNLGQVLHCAPPENYFMLHDNQAPAILIAGGIGITPIKPMAQSLRDRGLPFSLHYASKSANSMAFRDRLEKEFNQELSLYHSDESSRIDFSALFTTADKQSHVYICGPERMINDCIQQAKTLGFPEENIHFEYFQTANNQSNKAITVTLQKSKKTIEVSPDKSILDSVLDAGIDIPYSCKTGNCKSCAVSVLEGEPEHRDSVLDDQEKSEGKLICPCVSRARTDKLTLDI